MMQERMMAKTSEQVSGTVQARLLKAALECFLADEYHKVTTRLVAEKAGANIFMILVLLPG